MLVTIRRQMGIIFILIIMLLSITTAAAAGSWECSLVNTTSNGVVRVPHSEQNLLIERYYQDGVRVARYVSRAVVEFWFDDSGNVVPLWTNSETKDRVDASLSCRNVLTQYYNWTTVEGETYVEVEHYTSLWEQLDSQVIVKDAQMLAGASGYSLNGYQVYDTVEKNIGYAAFDTTYTLEVPSWWGYVQVSDDFPLYQAGQSSCLLRRTPSGTEWEFRVRVSQGKCDW